MFFIACVLASLSGEAVAQFEQGQTAGEAARRQQALEQLRREAEQRRREDMLMFPLSTKPRDVPTLFHLGYRSGLQQLFPRYEGLPTYPSNVPGYGGYPGAAKQPGGVGAGAPGARPSDKDRWPSWIETGTGTKGRMVKSTQAVLVRLTDRVWLRATGERAFVPLAFYDRFRFLETGGQVEVRGKGEFQLVLHDGGGLRSRGPCSLEVAGLNDHTADLQISTVEKVWLTAKLRPLRVRLPDGTQLEFSSSVVHLERRGDRIRVSNAGSGPIHFSGAVGAGEITGPRFISLWVAPAKTAPLSDLLQLKGRVSQSKTGGVTTISGGDDGRVIWSGASFALGKGNSLQIQPLKSAKRQR